MIATGIDSTESELLKSCPMSALRGDLVTQAISGQLFSAAQLPFSLTHFGPRVGVGHRIRLQWLCNGVSSGSLNTLSYIRGNTFERKKYVGLARFLNISAFIGAPDSSVSWERVYEKEVDHPVIYSVNQFRTLGGL